MPDVRGVAGDVLRVAAALKEGGVRPVPCSSRPLRHAGPAVDDGRRGAGLLGVRRAMPWAGKTRVAVELARRYPRRARRRPPWGASWPGKPAWNGGRPTRFDYRGQRASGQFPGMKLR